ncbi:ABC transporter substrate-binding protein [Paenibacillus motobuensis]|uniref:sugar ABC transporter substrate-binding protein n=1 Tax=Paenibacillus TaxID=44249 RepID=UPI00204084F4|nr:MULTISPECIES: ABC transporter substrate-binding protein [Paenibacillus]MCM3041567.1 ABC transporter substrate-binding protein [Paenibacillus lutimineralis]MCM3648671.1 ABC transporter substrate-binding protein [Paenibacillus motobuensis]
MKKTKKAFGFLAMMVLIASLVACGGKTNSNTANSGTDTNSSNTSGGTEKQAKISLFQSKVEIAEALEELANKYKEETGNEVEVWGSAGDAYITQLQAKLAAKEGPTIFSIATGAEAEKFKSYYYDMSNESFVKNIAPNMALEVDGKVVGVPIGVEGFGLVYNKSLVDPKDVTDLASFTSKMESLKAEGINGLSLSQEAYFLIGHILNTPFALQADPIDFINKLNNGEVKMADTKEFQEFAKFMEVIRQNSVNPMEVTYDTQMGDFATGKTAMVHQGNWSYGMLADYGDLDIGMMALPIAGNNKLSVDIPGGWVINNGAKPEEIKAANAFLDWLYNSETGKDTIVNKFKFIPAMTNIEADGLDPLSQAVFEATKSGNTISWAMNYFPQGIIVNDLTPVTSEFFLDNGMTGEQYLKNLDDAWAKAAK